MGAWLSAALDGGTIDPLWGEWDLTREIQPELVGEGGTNMGPVIEERVIPGSVRVFPNQWLDVATRYKKDFQKLNNGPEPSNLPHDTTQDAPPTVTIQVAPQVARTLLTTMPAKGDRVWINDNGTWREGRVFYAAKADAIVVETTNGKEKMQLSSLYS